MVHVYIGVRQADAAYLRRSLRIKNPSYSSAMWVGLVKPPTNSRTQNHSAASCDGLDEEIPGYGNGTPFYWGQQCTDLDFTKLISSIKPALEHLAPIFPLVEDKADENDMSCEILPGDFCIVKQSWGI